MSTPVREMTEQYLARIGMSRPQDAALQYQVTLLRQWTEHLADVLEAEEVPAAARSRIIRQMLYGGVPSLAEQELRVQMTQEMVNRAAEAAHPHW